MLIIFELSWWDKSAQESQVSSTPSVPSTVAALSAKREQGAWQEPRVSPQRYGYDTRHTQENMMFMNYWKVFGREGGSHNIFSAA